MTTKRMTAWKADMLYREAKARYYTIAYEAMTCAPHAVYTDARAEGATPTAAYAAYIAACNDDAAHTAKLAAAEATMNAAWETFQTAINQRKETP